MKNLRMSKKNPSKILKIIDGSSSNRYNHIHSQNNNNSHLTELAITTARQRSYRLVKQPIVNHSPVNSQRIIDNSSFQKGKKGRSKSLNRSEQLIKTQDKDPVKLIMKNSIGNRSRHEYSPYLKRSRYRESQNFLNFNSVNLSQKHRKQSKQSREIFKSTSRKKNSLLRVQSQQENERERKDDLQILENAKKMLNSGDYRKSLFMIKSILKIKPDHPEALYLSAVNWYHLEDKQRTHYYTEQLIRNNPSYSPQIYKLKAVCYLKTNEYSKGLINLCHQLFPDEPQSYEFQGKIYTKMRKWRDALVSYQKSYELTSSIEALGMVATCYEQLQQWKAALTCYTTIMAEKKIPVKFILKRLRIHYKRQQYQLIIQTFQERNDLEASFMGCRERDEIYYLCSYAYFKIKKYSNSLIMIDQGLRYCQHQTFATKFHRLLLMIKIIERDIYQAYHFLERIEDQPELQVLHRFIEGIINLMRRNHNQGIALLLSIQSQLGFRLQPSSSFSNHSQISIKQSGEGVTDEFCNQLRKSYLLFLSYGYIAISQFHTALRMMQLQRQIGIPSYFELGLSYNQQICTGVILHCDRKFKQAESHFIKAKAIYDNKLEPPFSLALNYLQLLVNSKSEVEKLSLIQQAKGQFDACKRIIGRAPSNTAASMYYFNSLLHGYLEEWKQALTCIDQSIDRAQDHYWRYFYIRGMLLACIHSFKQAINDTTIAINLSGSTKPECYLLRSKCLQIEGDGNQAFRDLQQYISLKPDDPQVHKYAGQLLFQNGAFEDSLTAFGHQPIIQKPQNYDVFLTQSKSFFLLGRFNQAIASISIANTLQPSAQIAFDIKILQFLNQLSSCKDFKIVRQQLETIYGDFSEVGRIFKVSDFYLLRATCYMLERKYSEALEAFTITIKQKSLQITGSDGEDEFSQSESRKEVQSFANQMYYNMIICNINLHQQHQAQQLVQKMKIALDQPFYSDYVNFKKWINGQVQIFKKQQVFPSRNKLSNFLPKVPITLGNNQTIDIKLCIPFPKVEPPEIFPSFDKSLLQRLSVLNVERKPEAPWILREINSIKFTEKIEVFSRLQIDDSQSQSGRSTFNMVSVDHSHLGRSSQHSRIKTDSIKKNSKHKLLQLIE